jgi:hypothetical protein
VVRLEQQGLAAGEVVDEAIRHDAEVGGEADALRAVVEDEGHLRSVVGDLEGAHGQDPDREGLAVTEEGRFEAAGSGSGRGRVERGVEGAGDGLGVPRVVAVGVGDQDRVQALGRPPASRDEASPEGPRSVAGVDEHAGTSPFEEGGVPPASAREDRDPHGPEGSRRRAEVKAATTVFLPPPPAGTIAPW